MIPSEQAADDRKDHDTKQRDDRAGFTVSMTDTSMRRATADHVHALNADTTGFILSSSEGQGR